MRWMRMVGIVAIFLALSAIPGHAVEEDEYEGVPAYSVTRLKIFEGTAWVRTPDSGDWEEFPTNSPVPARSLISIPDGSEAELQFHGGQFVLLTAGTELSVRGAEENATAFRLQAGEIRFFLPETDFAPVRVTIPGGGKTEFSVPGRYWMTASKTGETTLIVRKGEGTISRKEGELTVREGEQALIGEEVRISRYAGEESDSYQEPPPLSDTERQADVPPAAAYELRDYGEWVNSQEYGYVWRPRVSAGWSPYYYGRWDWVSPYGWTWISYEPWGWYPYHYGYWYTDPIFGWVWYPFHSFVSLSFAFGNYHYPYYHSRAYYYPANVRFVRDGGRVRWVPLRPGERRGRIAFTRSDSRLSSWEQPLSRGTVYVRGRGSSAGKWRDYTAVRRESREAVRARSITPLGAGGARMQSGSGTGPARREQGIDRSRPGRGERSQESIRGTDRPAQERPARPERLQRESPPSARPQSRSEPRLPRVREQDRSERYGNRVQGRGPSPVRAAPLGAAGQSPPRIRERVPALSGRTTPDAGRVLVPGAGGRAGPGRATTVERQTGNRSSSEGRSWGSWDGGGRDGGRGGYDFGAGGGRGGRSVR
jgi:hypothetical protein